MRPDISIVILNYKTPGLLKNCLQSIIQTRNNARYEIIVVNNGGDDGTSALLEQFKNIRTYFVPDNIGHAAGNNVGIRAAHGEFILLLNTDIVFLNDGILDACVESMKLHPRAAALGPMLQNPDGTRQYSARTFPTLSQPLFSRTLLGMTDRGKRYMSEHHMIDIDTSAPTPVDWIVSSAMCVRSDMVRTVGMMDERFFLYFADVDWCMRFRLHGFDVLYDPRIRCIHYYHRESAGGIRSLTKPVTRIHIKDWIAYIYKHYVIATAPRSYYTGRSDLYF